MTFYSRCAARLCLFLSLAGASLLSAPVFAACPVSALTLSSQAEVDAFPGTYAACVTVSVDLAISGADITNLGPLAGITTVSSPAKLVISSNPALADLDGLTLGSVYWLEISGNSSLTSIAGLSSLTSIGGPLFITNNALLTNVTGLGGITALPGGTLSIEGNPSLTDLMGVSNITSMGGTLYIGDNDALANLDALSNLTSTPGLNVIGNAALTSISGLSNVTNVGTGSVNVQFNPLLASLSGLSGLTSLGGLNIRANNSLTNLDALSNLTSVGNIEGLVIWDNTALTSIDGLAALEGVDWLVQLTGNTSLSQCTVLDRLLDQVDDFAAGPGPYTGEDIPDVNGPVTINSNAAGCNDLADIVLPPSAPPPGPGGATAIPTLGNYGLLALVLLLLVTAATRLRREH